MIWIPFFRPKLWKNAQALGPKEDGDFLIEKYPARPLEKWVHGFNFGNLWMYDPSRLHAMESQNLTHNPSMLRNPAGTILTAMKTLREGTGKYPRGGVS